VIYLNCTVMHGLTNLKFMSVVGCRKYRVSSQHLVLDSLGSYNNYNLCVHVIRYFPGFYSVFNLFRLLHFVSTESYLLPADPRSIHMNF